MALPQTFARCDEQDTANTLDESHRRELVFHLVAFDEQRARGQRRFAFPKTSQRFQLTRIIRQNFRSEHV